MRAASHAPDRLTAPWMFGRCAAARLLVIGVLLSVSGPAGAQTIAPTATWYRWWEINKNEYLEPPPKQAPVPRGVRSYVEDALIVATRSPLPGTRAAAALALGRMGASDDAAQRLAEMTAEADRHVTAYAWIALALLDSPKARAFLLTKRTLDEQDTIAWVTALGLLDKSDDQVIGALKWFVAQNKSDLVREMALRSIWTLKPPNTRDVMLVVLNNTDSPHLACVAIQGLGAVHDPRDVPLLLDLLGHVGVATKLGIDRAVLAGNNQYYDAYVNDSQTCAAMALSNYPDLGWAARRVGIAPATLRVAMDRYLIFYSTTSLEEYYKNLTVINLGRLGDLDALPGLLQIFEGLRLPPVTVSTIVPGSIRHGVGFQQGQHLGLPVNTARAPPVAGIDLPAPEIIINPSSRMFAAIALGLHLRKLGDQIQTDREAEASGARPDPYRQQRDSAIQVVSTKLAARLADPSESNELRAACALGLGLSGKRENADLIVQSAKSISKASDMVPGFAMLALGMLHDPRAIGGADRLLGPPTKTLDVQRILKGDVSDTPYVPYMQWMLTPMTAARKAMIITRSPMETILARRAAALGLSLVTGAETLPPLRGSWGYEYSISQEVAKALAAHGDYGETDSLVAILKDKKAIVAPVLAAWTLGEMFDRTGRLNRLVPDTDFLYGSQQWYMPPTNQSWYPIFRIANEFPFQTGIAFTSGSP